MFGRARRVPALMGIFSAVSYRTTPFASPTSITFGPTNRPLPSTQSRAGARDECFRGNADDIDATAANHLLTTLDQNGLDAFLPKLNGKCFAALGTTEDDDLMGFNLAHDCFRLRR